MSTAASVSTSTTPHGRPWLLVDFRPVLRPTTTTAFCTGPTPLSSIDERDGSHRRQPRTGRTSQSLVPPLRPVGSWRRSTMACGVWNCASRIQMTSRTGTLRLPTRPSPALAGLGKLRDARRQHRVAADRGAAIVDEEDRKVFLRSSPGDPGSVCRGRRPSVASRNPSVPRFDSERL